MSSTASIHSLVQSDPARAEVIDVDQVIRQKREAERDASNRGRRGR